MATSLPCVPRYRCSSSTTRVKTLATDARSQRAVASNIGCSTSRMSIALSIE